MRKALVTTIVCLAAAATRADDWTQWLGPNRNGVSAEKNWDAKRLTVAWRKRVGKGYAIVTAVGTKVYTMGNDGAKDVIWCLDADSGREIWKYTYALRGGGGGYPGARIAPTIDDGRLYTVSLKGHIHCLDATTGKLVWKHEMRRRTGFHGFVSHPLIDGDRVIFERGERNTSVVAFDKKTGGLLWRSGKRRMGYTSPNFLEVDGKRQVVVWTTEALIGMDPSDGRELWHFRTKIRWDGNIATPLVSGNRVFISSVYYDKGSTLLIVRNNTPIVIWHSDKLLNHCTNSVLWRGHLYGVDGWVKKNKRGKGILKCVELRTGRVKWEHKGFGTGGVMVADGKLIIQGDRGELAIAEATPKRFRLLSQSKPLDGMCWNMPVLASGRIYCRSWEGELVCVDVRKR